MKFNFRKIASVLASTVMLSSTVALAAAANYPAPFVSSGVADVAVVYGANAAQTDLVAATDITTSLNSKLVTSGAATSVSGGDFFKLEKSTSLFTLDKDLNDIYSTLDDEELSTVLEAGVYMNDANEEFDFEQSIYLYGLPLGLQQDNDFNDEKPYIGFDLGSGTAVLNYTLEFTPDAADCGDFGASTTIDDDCETTDLTMLGRTYYVVKTEATANGVKLTLLDSANSATITEGETSSMTVGGASYDVSIVFIDSDEVILDVNGAQTNKLAEGDVFKVTNTDLYAGVKNILYNEKESGISKVEISLGSGKIVLENGQELELNNEDISDLTDPEEIVTTYITNTSAKIDKIVLNWKVNEDMWMAEGTDLLLPGFETIKLSMGGFIEPKHEVTSLEADGEEAIKLSTTVTDGDVSFDILYNNATSYTGIGEDANHRLVTSKTAELIFNDTKDDQFVVYSYSGDEGESYLMEFSKIDDSSPNKNTTTIKSVGSGKEYSLDIGETETIGDKIDLTLNAANKATKILNFTISGSGTEGFDRLITEEGLKIQLPVASGTATGDGYLNTTGSSATWTMNFTEEDKDENVLLGYSFTATLGLNSDGEAQVSSVSVTDYETEDNSDVWEGYVESPLATKTIFDVGGDQDTLDVEYHGSESYAEVYVSESGAAIIAEGGVTIIPVKDSEAPAAKNLVVVGGSCVNSVAASLLGGALCGAEFEARTGVGAGSFLIETFSRDGGAVATLVAGYNAGDTTNAAKYLTTQTVDTTVGKKYKGTSATAATLVVA